MYDVLAAGINYADTHQTEDSYLARQVLPLIPGGEVVVRDADGRRRLGLMSGGGYAQRIAGDPRRLIPIPDGVSDADALTTLVQGATAWHLLRTRAPTSRPARRWSCTRVPAGSGRSRSSSPSRPARV